MKIEEIKNENFIREYKITVPFQEINIKVEAKVVEAAKFFKMPGFRKGKVPLTIVRQKVGKDETEKQIQEQISCCIEDLIDSKNIRPSSRPDVQILSFDEENGLSGKIIIEVLPKIPEIKWDTIEIESIKINISDNEISEIKNMLLRKFREYKNTKDGYKVKNGDKVNIDFYGQIDGKDFEGNKGEKMNLVIGDNKFLQGFEEQLINSKVGKECLFELVFPKDYPKEKLANKKSVFKVKINEIRELDKIKDINFIMFKKLGVESEEKLNEFIKENLNIDFVGTIRVKMKKELFDKIDKKYNFDLPQKMVDQDFDIIWKEIEKNKEKDENFKNKNEEELKLKYQKISKRRVKLGLIMAEVARKNNVTITDEELNQIIKMQAKQNPQIKDKILEFYKNSENLEKIKGAILEEKALDLILSKVIYKNIEMTYKEFVKNVLPVKK